MTDETINGDSAVSKTAPVTGVLLLRPPPPQWDATRWHGQPVAGVPFLLRNLLNLYRGGMERLIVYSRKENEIAETFRQQIRNDPRLLLPIDWVSDPRQLPQAQVEGPDLLLLDGSTLYDKLRIRDAVESAQSLANRPENPGRIDWESILKQADDLNSGPLESSHNTPVKILSGEDRITREEDLRAQNERLLKTCGLNNDSLMDRLVTRSISRHLTRLFLDTPFSPNQITILSLMLGLASAWCFFQGDYLTGLGGSLLLILSAWIDCTDGEIARLKFMESKLGGRLDILSDNLVHFAVFFGIGMGLYYSTGEPVYKLLGGLAVLGSVISFAILGSTVTQKKANAGDGETQTKDLADQLANRDFIYFLLLMAVMGRLDIFIILTAVGSNAFALYLITKKLRSTNMEPRT